MNRWKMRYRRIKTGGNVVRVDQAQRGTRQKGLMEAGIDVQPPWPPTAIST
jgi:hypothetical protein